MCRIWEQVTQIMNWSHEVINLLNGTIFLFMFLLMTELHMDKEDILQNSSLDTYIYVQ